MNGRSVTRGIRFVRDRLAPQVCCSVLDGLTRAGLLEGLRQRMSPSTYQTLLRTTNWGRLFTPGRRFLERALMPALLPPDGTTVVLVGLHPYTAHYSWFYLGQEVVAIDPDPGMGRYAGRARFAAVALRDLRSVTRPASATLVHCNGVYGWGLDDPTELSESLDQVADALAPGGRLLLGYNLGNNNPLHWTEKTPLPQRCLVECHGMAYPVCLANNQVFRVFQKPA